MPTCEEGEGGRFGARYPSYPSVNPDADLSTCMPDPGSCSAGWVVACGIVLWTNWAHGSSTHVGLARAEFLEESAVKVLISPL